MTHSPSRRDERRKVPPYRVKIAGRWSQREIIKQFQRPSQWPLQFAQWLPALYLTPLILGAGCEMQAYLQEAIDLLKCELSNRKTRNSNYSIRALARDAGLASSYLTHVLHGDRTLSEEKALEVGGRLNWPESKRRLFSTLFRAANARSPEALTLAEDELQILRSQDMMVSELSLDEFQTVSEWYHFAIVELTQVSDFKSDTKWIAERLGIEEGKAAEAIERLRRLGLIRVSNSHLERAHDCYGVGHVPSEAIRNVHKELLTKAVDSIESLPHDRRHLVGSTIAISVDKLPQARELLMRFHKEMIKLCESGNKDSVYHFSTQFFPLCKNTGH